MHKRSLCCSTMVSAGGWLSVCNVAYCVETAEDAAIVATECE